MTGQNKNFVRSFIKLEEGVGIHKNYQVQQKKTKFVERKSRTSLFEGNSDYEDIKLDLKDAHTSSSDTFEEIMQNFKNTQKQSNQ